MKNLLLAAAVLSGLALATPATAEKTTAPRAGKASDDLVLKCRAGVFRKYGKRTPDGKYLALRDYDAVRLVDFCISNGGKVL